MTTIEVHHRYIVGADETLSFTDEPAFHIDPGANATADLINAGEVRVTEDRNRTGALAIETTTGSATVSFLNRQDATLAVSSSGTNSNATAAEFGLSGSANNKGLIDVFADHGAAFGIVATSDRFDLDNTGILHVEGSSAYAVDLQHAGDVANAGTISAISDGHYNAAHGVRLGGDGSLTNDGLIEARSRGLSVGVEMLHGVGDLHNSGKIVASTIMDEEDCTGVFINGSTADTHVTIDNSGQIIVKQPESFPTAIALYSSSLAGVYTDLDNSGKIVGDIRGYTGSLHLHDTGQIDGDVRLSDGDDLVEISGRGAVSGEIHTGDGADTVMGGRQAETIRSDEGFFGAGSGEDVVFGGGGDDLIVAGAGSDQLTGGLGGDTLKGGNGADRFIYQAVGESRGEHTDLITDLASEDRIDLSAIDAAKHAAGDQAFTLVDHLDGHAGQAALTYDAGSDVTLLQLDVNGDGVADAAVRLAGDQTGYDNFVL